MVFSVVSENQCVLGALSGHAALSFNTTPQPQANLSAAIVAVNLL
jgi:hypothetical protein